MCCCPITLCPVTASRGANNRRKGLIALDSALAAVPIMAAYCSRRWHTHCCAGRLCEIFSLVLRGQNEAGGSAEGVESGGSFSTG